VVPLVPAAFAPKPIKDLNPVFEVDGEPFVFVTQAIASFPAKDLKRAAASLDSQHDLIIRALDILMIGF
jgi:toxin CcdB